MNWKAIKSDEDYQKASLRLMEIFHATPKSIEHDELELLIILIKDFDDKHYQLPELDILEIIKFKMKEQGIKAKDLEPIVGSKGHVSAILSGKREITLKMAKKLRDFFSLPAELFFQSA
jgi:HTH-type transcriptional regulator/antitoxin HigA